MLQTLQSFKSGNKEENDASQKQLVIKPGTLPMLPPAGFRGETACQRCAMNVGVQPAAVRFYSPVSSTSLWNLQISVLTAVCSKCDAWHIYCC